MIRVAICGVGNCASSLIQGTHYYRDVKIGFMVPGLLHPVIGGYKPGDIEVVAAFDIDARKVGKDICDAIFEKPNNTKTFYRDVPRTDVKVLRGPTLDGFAPHLLSFPENQRFVESEESPIDVTAALKDARPDMLINYLPVGSEAAAKYYANACLDARVSFVNAVPVFICSGEGYVERFEDVGQICVGDDIKSQFGATIVHRTLARLGTNRGVILERTYQLNTGGNTDFLNMLAQDRLASKRISKTESVQSQLAVPLLSENIHIGPSDFVPWQKDNKVCFLRMEFSGFGGIPIELELRLSVEDSPNSAGVMTDVIRCVKLGLDKGMRGYLDEVSAFGFKHPKRQYTDEEACRRINEFIDRNSHR